MSDGYVTIDLDETPKADEPQIVVEEEQAPVEELELEEDKQEPVEEKPANKGATRHQRLKAARDRAIAEAEAARAEVEALKAKIAAMERDAGEATGAAVDFYIKQLEDSIKSARDSYNAALAAGDQEKLFDIQVRIAEAVAQKQQMEARRAAAIPPKNASGSEAPPATATAKPPRLSAAAQEWRRENSWWLNKDKVATAAVRELANEMVSEGWDPNDSDYFEELDRRLRAELPHKFRDNQAKRPATLQNRGNPGPTGGKLTVRITPEDRELANRMGIDIKEYARQKAMHERAATGVNQGYVEI